MCCCHEDEDKVTKQGQGREYQRQGRYVKEMKGDGKVELRTVIKIHSGANHVLYKSLEKDIGDKGKNEMFKTTRMFMTTTSAGGEVNLGLERKDGEGEGHSSSDSNLERKP